MRFLAFMLAVSAAAFIGTAAIVTLLESFPTRALFVAIIEVFL